jgi:parallel beta-helix repeat protein
MPARCLAAIVLLAAPLAVANAGAALDNCTGFVTTLPATLTRQGTWCLATDLLAGMSSGAAITISASNVTLDCNHFRIGGLAAGPATQATGVLALGRANVTVRNCSIRGFRYGVRLEGSGHVVEDNRLDNSTRVGILVAGDGSIVRRNRVLDTGASGVETLAAGISTGGSVDIVDNTVANVAALPTAGLGSNFGIRTSGNLAGSVVGNRIRGIVVEASGWAIWNEGTGRVVVADNNLLGRAQTGDGGIRCAGAQGTATGNAVVGFSTGITGCTEGAGNNELP